MHQSLSAPETRAHWEHQKEAFRDLCLKFDPLLDPAAPAPSADHLDDLTAFAHVFDLETEGLDGAAVWRQVRVLLSDDQAPVADAPRSFSGRFRTKVFLPAGEGAPVSPQALNLLVAEDDPDIAAFVLEVLTEAGHNVVALASDVEQASTLSALHTIDLAILDVRLADGGDGVELARLLDQRWGIPVLFLSGATNEHLVDFGSAVGFLGKPFRSAELLAAVNMARRLIDHSEGAQNAPAA